MTQKQPTQVTSLDAVFELWDHEALFNLINWYRGLCRLKALLYAEPLQQVAGHNRAACAGDTRTPKKTWRSVHQNHKSLEEA